VERFREVLLACGFAMAGQSERIVPADRLLYALRDVTGTVESIPLITASIMSKKFAEGAQALVFDVKCGSGAFMKSQAEARALAVSLARTGASLGRRVRAVISDMDQPLGRMVGNFLEVRECVEVLQGRGPDDLIQLTLRLTAHMLVLGGLAPDLKKGEALCRERLEDGTAWRRFLSNVEAQGGRADALLDPDKGYHTPRTLALRSPRSGFLARLEAYRMGLASGLLGASRSRKEDPVWPEVGIQLLKVAGDRVREGEELFLLHGRDSGRLEEARRLAEEAVTVSDQPPPPRHLLLEEIDADALGED
jgi:pyrimidine-nucleoside phosphorylase